MANFGEDVEDINVVALFLASKLGYIIDLVVGHSKGSVAAMTWLCHYDTARTVRGFVNVSGRYRMEASIIAYWANFGAR